MGYEICTDDKFKVLWIANSIRAKFFKNETCLVCDDYGKTYHFFVKQHISQTDIAVMIRKKKSEVEEKARVEKENIKYLNKLISGKE